MNFIEKIQPKGIIEYVHCRLEGYSMLLFVDGVFLFIPFKLGCVWNLAHIYILA